MKKRDIAESLEPTFENVTREFITETMYDILFKEELPNFTFEFREEEAIKFIEEILQKHASKDKYFKEKSIQILDSIKEKSDNNKTKPIMIINN